MSVRLAVSDFDRMCRLAAKHDISAPEVLRRGLRRLLRDDDPRVE